MQSCILKNSRFPENLDLFSEAKDFSQSTNSNKKLHLSLFYIYRKMISALKGETHMDALQNSRRLFIIEGILFLILGILAVALPVVFTIGVELMIGWLFVIAGLVQGYRAFKNYQRSGFALSLLTALIYLLFGILLVANPIAGALSLTLILTFFFLFDGISKIIFAFRLRPLSNWGWLLFSGLISLAMAFIIWSGWPQTGLWVIGLLVGINLIFTGTSLLMLGLSLPKSSDVEDKHV